MIGKVIAVGAMAVLAIPTAAVVLLVGTVGATAGPVPSPDAAGDIPARLLPVYVAAAGACPGLAWTVLAAIGEIETDHGRHGGGTLTASGDVVPPIIGPALDGAGGGRGIPVPAGGSRWHPDPVWDHPIGPMQFITSTWTRWGRDANNDGTANPHNAIDAIWTAAGYLCGPDGQVDDLDAAILSYNRSPAYLAEVLATADRYGGLALAPTGDLTAAVLANPNLTITGAARRDLEQGLIDPRLVQVLDQIGQRFTVGVGVMRTGHAQCVGGGARTSRPSCSISNHWYGRAVDLFSIDGQPVTTANSPARTMVLWLFSLPDGPDELGVPWPDLAPLAGVFSDASHQDHLHIGFELPA